MSAALRECRYCAETHGDLLLCEPARKVLDAMADAGQRFDMPTVEFPEPVADAGMFGPGTVLCAQIVAKAATVGVAGVSRPCLILTGRDASGGTLPSWVFPNDDAHLTALAQMIADVAGMAIRAAAKARREGRA